MRLNVFRVVASQERDQRGRTIDRVLPEGAPRELQGRDLDLCRREARELLRREGWRLRALNATPDGLRAYVDKSLPVAPQLDGYVWRGDAAALRARGSMRRPIEHRTVQRGDPSLLSPVERARLAQEVPEGASEPVRQMATQLRLDRQRSRAEAAAVRAAGR